MIPICTEIENLIHPVQLREDEYINESGLICCSKCRTPRQKRIDVTGRTMEPRCLCKCQQAAQEKREQERKHQEFLDMVAKNAVSVFPTRNCADIPLKMIWATTPNRSTWPSGTFSTGRNSRKIPPDFSSGAMWAPAKALSQVVSQMRCWTRGCR